MQPKYFRVYILQFFVLVTPVIFSETAAQTQKQPKQTVISASIAEGQGGKKMIKYTYSHSASGWIINAAGLVVRDRKEMETVEVKMEIVNRAK